MATIWLPRPNNECAPKSPELDHLNGNAEETYFCRQSQHIPTKMLRLKIIISMCFTEDCLFRRRDCFVFTFCQSKATTHIHIKCCLSTYINLDGSVHKNLLKGNPTLLLHIPAILKRKPVWLMIWTMVSNVDCRGNPICMWTATQVIQRANHHPQWLRTLQVSLGSLINHYNQPLWSLLWPNH